MVRASVCRGKTPSVSSNYFIQFLRGKISWETPSTSDSDNSKQTFPDFPVRVDTKLICSTQFLRRVCVISLLFTSFSPNVVGFTVLNSKWTYSTFIIKCHLPNSFMSLLSGSLLKPVFHMLYLHIYCWIFLIFPSDDLFWLFECIGSFIYFS